MIQYCNHKCKVRYFNSPILIAFTLRNAGCSNAPVGGSSKPNVAAMGASASVGNGMPPAVLGCCVPVCKSVTVGTPAAVGAVGFNILPILAAVNWCCNATDIAAGCTSGKEFTLIAKLLWLLFQANMYVCACNDLLAVVVLLAFAF